MNPMHNKTPEERKAIAEKAVKTRLANIAIRKAREAEDAEKAFELRSKVAQLEKRIKELARTEKLHLASAALTGTALLSAKEIAAGSLPWNRACGVYFLLDGDEVVYVGQAVNVYSRIDHHRGKKFDRYAFVPCQPSMLDRLESLYIHFLKPRLNGVQADDGMYAPLSLRKLIGIESAQSS
jgi:predicted GIY-YIG superfamily endonuclease